ncbi:MAG: esterase/lipase family protein [Telluria sp.]
MRSSEIVRAALNGLIGDRLAEAGNPLAIQMRFRRDGRPLALEAAALAEDIPGASGKVLVLVHGLCHSDVQWSRDGHDHGAALSRDLGYTTVYLHYNSGLHISTNGREFAQLLDALVASWPVEVEELSIIGYSMGGLVTRSACHYGKRARAGWLRKLRHVVFLGTPHHGVPLERGGNWLTLTLGGNMLTAPVARLARLRSAGITDLRHGSLVDEDWRGRDRFAHRADQGVHVPLPSRVKCYAIAGTAGRRPGDLRDRLLGDGIVPLAAALGRHAELERTLRFAKSREWVGFSMHHLELLGHPDVYETLLRWLGPTGAKGR